MSEPNLKAILIDKDYDVERLDELVHSAASGLASNANNGGLTEQLSFLLLCGFEDEDIITALGL